MISPENVDVLEDDQLLAIADYDASKVFLYKNNKKQWSIDVPLAHDVSFNPREKTLFALGLGPPMIYKLTYGGKLLSKNGEIGWGENGYLWPTGISIKNDDIAITDAHTGKITFIDQAMSSIKVIGGNGVGVDVFNMPYAIELHNNNFLYLADTFKGRILEIDYKKKIITKVYQGARLIKEAKAHATAKQNSCAKLIKNRNPEGFVRNETSNKRLDKNQVVKIKFDYLPKSIKSLMWYTTYNGFSNVLTGQDLHLNRSTIFAHYPYYFIYGKNYKIKGMNFLIFGSPTTETWLVLHEGIVCPVEVGLDYWIDNQSLVSSNGKIVPLRRIAKSARDKIIKYKNDIKSGALPVTAIKRNILCTDEFDYYLELSLNTEKGKKMLFQLKQSTSGVEQDQAAKDYINSLEYNDPMFLVEIAFANTIIEGYAATPKGFILKLYYNISNSESLDWLAKRIHHNIITVSVALMKRGLHKKALKVLRHKKSKRRWLRIFGVSLS